jgi:DNA-nicking Smr family endonuclease
VNKKPFNDAFAQLKGLQKKEEPKPKKAAPPPPPKKKEAPELDEAALFLQSVGEVEPVRGPAKVVGEKTPPRPQIRSDEDEVLTQLSELVAGEGPFDLADSDEFIEGNVGGLDRRIVQKLKRGEYALQGHVDLHGLTRAEAKEALEKFLLAARQGGRRCVLVVHGRGLHSKDQIPILKESVQTWLSRGRLAKIVLAFASARPHDGGAGAVYVLLRR